MVPRVLLIEDDPNVLELVSVIVRDLGFEPIAACDGRRGLALALEGTFALVLLDVMLPELDGIEVCQQIRQHDERLPIIMLTAKGEELDRVVGLELGADDYLTKPFSSAELRARIKAIFRRSRWKGASEDSTDEVEDYPLIEANGVRIDCNRRVAEVRGEPVTLTQIEFDLLAYLASHPGRAFTREELLRAVWDQYADGYLATVNAHINRLRKKIEEDAREPKLIVTVRGFGYRFSES